MFKIGDEVVCINPDMSGYHNNHWRKSLYHIYRVDFVCPKEFFYGYDINDKSVHRTSTLLEYKNFISLIEHRKLKLNKICSKLEI